MRRDGLDCGVRTGCHNRRLSKPFRNPRGPTRAPAVFARPVVPALGHLHPEQFRDPRRPPPARHPHRGGRRAGKGWLRMERPVCQTRHGTFSKRGRTPQLLRLGPAFERVTDTTLRDRVPAVGGQIPSCAWPVDRLCQAAPCFALWATKGRPRQREAKWPSPFQVRKRMTGAGTDGFSRVGLRGESNHMHGGQVISCGKPASDRRR